MTRLVISAKGVPAITIDVPGELGITADGKALTAGLSGDLGIQHNPLAAAPSSGTDAAGNQHAQATAPLPQGASEIMSMFAEAAKTTPLGSYNGYSGARMTILSVKNGDLAYRYPTYADFAKATVDYPYNVNVILPDHSVRVLKSHVDKPQPIDWFLWIAGDEIVRCDAQARITDGLEFMIPAAEGALAVGPVHDPAAAAAAGVGPAVVAAVRGADGLLAFYPNSRALYDDAVATHYQVAITVDGDGIFSGFGPPDSWVTRNGRVERA